MKRKNAFLATLVFVLALCFVLSGCDNNGDSGDTWSLVTNANQSQLNGTWRGAFAETVDYDVDGTGIKVREAYNITLTINASAGTVEGRGPVTFTFSGGNINEAWLSIKSRFSNVTFNDSNHSATGETQFTSSLNNFLSQMQPEINQNGTRIRGSMSNMGTFVKSGYLVMNKQ